MVGINMVGINVVEINVVRLGCDTNRSWIIRYELYII